jgi:hypothetical protein
MILYHGSNKELTFRDLSEQVSFHTERAAARLQYNGVQYG